MLRSRLSVKNFLKSSTLHSLKYLQEDNQKYLHIGIWLAINAIFMAMTVLLIMAMWDRLTENPTVTSLENTNYPVTEVPFPAVSICNINKISKRKAEIVANFISETTGHSMEVIDEYMRILGSFYDYDDSYSHKMLEFQKILENFDHVDEFKPVKLMQWLTPSCDDFLVNCHWQSQEVNCSDMFQMRLTYEGYCCIFNYIKKTNEIVGDSFRDREVLFGYPGLGNGLTVELRNELDDYFYTKQASLGANVHVFDPMDYPDKNSGSLNEFLVGFATEYFLQIETKGIRSVEDVINYPLDKRGCYFRNERKTVFGDYSESDCLLECRIKSMKALCGCVPFMIPQNQTLVCGLSDIQCLHKYRIKWESLSPPYTERTEELMREIQYSLRCDDRCYPVCQTHIYEAFTNPAHIKDLSYGNNTILHIYYTDRFSTLYRQDVYYYWFEILSKVGTIFGFILGISVISLLEVVVFCTYKIHHYLHNNITLDNNCCAFCIWNF
ncbi:sodium channel protein Nach-like isoform X2 [Tenebrio molitor]|uniref:sodium channel protein Nach-like isoform X2 n=1 Tax=Tenebrio molitor TaxID=7067 RepID=UPI0036249AFC